MHHIFCIKDKKLRGKFLELAIQEQLGDLQGRNIENYLPHQILHMFDFNSIPEHLADYFKEP